VAKRYLKDLRRAFQAEVFGEASYAVMARLTRDPERRAKLETLRRLETRTKGRLGEAISGQGHDVRESWIAKLLGASAAVATAPLPWRVELKILKAFIKVTLPAFERFERQWKAQDPELASDLARHERAQLEFLERELEGLAASLEPVRALLT
jgi:hypothetical protein